MPKNASAETDRGAAAPMLLAGAKVKPVSSAYDAFGPQRLMWASSCPYYMSGANAYEATLALVRNQIDFFTIPTKISAAEDRQARLLRLGTLRLRRGAT